MDLRSALKSQFNHAEFRPHQEEIIGHVMAGRDTLGVLPTGAGKSLCYQLPALLLPRPTLVISPLIALMQDQLDGLPAAVYPRATLINSSIDPDEMSRRLEGIESGRYRLIYAAPERLRQRAFLDLLRGVGLSLVVVDEAHCVSVWGHDFRPDYLFIRRVLAELSELGNPPTLLALTATATPEMQAEIGTQLGRGMKVVAASTFRPNLRIEVLPCPGAEAKMQRLAAVCRETAGPAIVYAGSRDRCEEIASFLNDRGVKAAYYHAGMEREERRRSQEEFMLGRTRVMVATVAFGMGVDKANVRLVAHFNLPASLEAYTQEAGRAGRDGKPSRCVLLYTAADKANLRRWLHREELKLDTVRSTYRAVRARIGKHTGMISPRVLLADAFGEAAGFPESSTRLRVAISALEHSGLLARHPDVGRDLRLQVLPPPPGARAKLEALLTARSENNEARLAEIVAYAEGLMCRHAAIARHFGQALEPCRDACDICRGTAEAPSFHLRSVPPSADRVPDVGRILLEMLSGLPRSVSRTELARAAAGAPNSPFPAATCPNHGLLAGFTLKKIREFADRLIAEGLVSLDREVYELHLMPAGTEALQTGRPVLANPNRPARVVQTAGADGRRGGARSGADEDDRFEELRAWRRIEAQRAQVAPFLIFSDATLGSIAGANPATLEALACVPGIGDAKLERYGTAVMEVLHAAR